MFILLYVANYVCIVTASFIINFIFLQLFKVDVTEW